MEYTEEQVEEMVREAVDKTERSFGGTFKRLKSENEELRAQVDAAQGRFEAESAALESQIAEFNHELAEKGRKVGELTIRGEIRRQLAEGGPLPERFIPTEGIPYSDNPEELEKAVANAISRGREEFETVLREAGINVAPEPRVGSNPTNPAGRDAAVVRDLKAVSAREALSDMARRGLIR
jgi:hypothetical protein